MNTIWHWIICLRFRLLLFPWLCYKHFDSMALRFVVAFMGIGFLVRYIQSTPLQRTVLPSLVYKQGGTINVSKSGQNVSINYSLLSPPTNTNQPDNSKIYKYWYPFRWVHGVCFITFALIPRTISPIVGIIPLYFSAIFSVLVTLFYNA
jgi:hypothetical protein